MSTPWFRRLSDGLSTSRERLGGQLNVLLSRGPDLDEEFWSDLEDTLIGADMGFTATTEIVDAASRDSPPSRRFPTPRPSSTRSPSRSPPSSRPTPRTSSPISPVTVLVVGVNGTGKTTTVGKLAKQAKSTRAAR